MNDKKMDNSNAVVNLKISWVDLLGENDQSFSGDERLKRWLKWIQIAKENKELDLLEYWTDTSECEACIHLDDSNFWCNHNDLPITVNPILTIKHGIIGMACMGIGKKIKTKINQ